MTEQEKIELINAALIGARDYVSNVNHADYFIFPERSGNERETLCAVIYKRENILQALNTDKWLKACKFETGNIKLAKIRRDRLRQAFGVPIATLPLDIDNYNELEKDRKTSFRSTAFEKTITTLLNNVFHDDFIWTGALKNVQVDIIGKNSKIRIEVKGLRGRFAKETA